MKKALLLIMILIMLTVVASCGGDQSSSSPAGDTQTNITAEDPSVEFEEITSYATGYKVVRRVSEALTDKVNSAIDENNYALEERHPQDFYDMADYVGFSMPLAFVSVDMAFTASLDEDTKKARLALTDAATSVIKTALSLLGIETVEKM